MSLDVYLASFDHGSSPDVDWDAVREIVTPFVSLESSDEFATHLVTADGGAHCFGFGEGSLFSLNRPAGYDIWYVIFDVARRCPALIMMPDSPFLAAGSEIVPHLPDGFTTEEEVLVFEDAGAFVGFVMGDPSTTRGSRRPST